MGRGWYFVENKWWWSKFLGIYLNITDVQIFQGSIKSETAVHRCTKKTFLKSFKKFTEKQLYMCLCLNRVVGIQPATLFKKRSFFPVSSAKW